MNKKLLPLAVAVAMAAPLAAQAAGSGPTIYGVAHVALENVDDDDRDDDTWVVNSRQSRFGIKGSEDLGNGLSAIYKMEFQVDLDGDRAETNTVGGGALNGAVDRNTGDDLNTSLRNSYVGLQHKKWGTFLMGRHDTPMKFMTISRDQFNTKLGDWNEVAGNSGVTAPRDRRANNAILYKTPSFNGFEAAVMLAPSEESEIDNWAGTSDSSGDKLDGGITSIGARYVNGPLYIGAAWEQSDYEAGNSETLAGTTSYDEEETWRIAASYDIAGFRISGLWEEGEDVGNAKDTAGSGIDNEHWQLALSYKFGNTVVKGAYQEGEQDHTTNGMSDLEYESISVGVEHHFSKRTQIYAIYNEVDDDGPGNTDDTEALSLGILHKF